ncbi:hypothetical protein B1992_09320 [Pseudoxanthomonas broegbernensis]|uniref:DUF819 family protein n=1 Tax=Pseudoxanthomonas broegbernensis TaxID=83619 RepID=A0A7V8GM38_9GAMM|nr:DUF819 family protein [Pseudoxanthomonas broegbernensis]KAF1686129.1 hypothetical protein B1992_09320 [Pseudoxanthomonas broegbernensis]MBB6063828.1 putative membrane protein [Pseudoxanthomonas broegbernensis]
MAIQATAPSAALVQNDIVLFGLIAATLGAIFWLASGPTPFWRKFFAWIPALLLCYFVPALYNTVGLIDGVDNHIYNPVASRVLLPAALVLLTLSVDLKGILRLGPRLLFVFCAGTLGVVLGAMVSFQAMAWLHPPAVAGDTWKGMAALAGSWIGGGANMVAIREVYQVDATLFGQFAVVDVAIASLWMATLLFLANRAARIDARSGADTRALDEMQARIVAYEAANARIPSLTDLMLIVGLAFGAVGLAHALGAPVAAWFAANVANASQFSLDSSFVWVVVLSTLAGLGLSFTPVRRLESAGASKLGTVFLYFLIASIGMQMDFMELAGRPELLAIGAIWMLTHVLVIWLAARLLKAPLFYFAIGSQGNIGAAASAPVVAAAFHPSLAPVGVLLGTVGYASGTVIAYGIGQILRVMAGQ